MTRQCLSQWISNIDLLMKELSAWKDERNSNNATVNSKHLTQESNSNRGTLSFEAGSGFD